MVSTQLKSQVDGIQPEQDNIGIRLAYLSQEHNQRTEDMEASNTRLFEAQENFKGMLRTLARQVESLQGGAHSGLPQSENSAPVVMAVEDLKSKVTCLMEEVEHDTFEGQLECWQQRLPRRSVGEDLAEIQSSVELQFTQQVGQFLSLDPRVEGSKGITSGLVQQLYALA